MLFSLARWKEQSANALIFSCVSLCCFSLAYAAISWPAAPAGEVSGGKYSTSLVPSGAIMAFNLATCPNGWKIADGSNSTLDLRGRFLRGLDSGAGNDPDCATRVGGCALGSYQVDELKSHIHGIPVYGYAGSMSAVASDPHIQTWGAYNSQATGGNETRPKNIAVLFCQKN